MSATIPRERDPDIDLGHDHRLFFIAWDPDRRLNPQYDGIPSVEKYAALVEHPSAKDGSPCAGAITLAGEVQAKVEPDKPTWTVHSWEPFHIEPSLLCDCGDHGFIRNGQWEPC